MKETKVIPEGTPTQVAHPWRAVLRTFVAAGVGVLVTWLASVGIDLESLSEAMTESITYGLFTLITSFVTWLLAQPGVNRFLENHLSVLSTGVTTEN